MGGHGGLRHEALGAGMGGMEYYTEVLVLGTCSGGLIQYIGTQATRRARPMGGV